MILNEKTEMNELAYDRMKSLIKQDMPLQYIQLCKEKGVSIAKLEKETGISNGTIGKWSKSSPTAEKLERVADFFGVSVDYLLGRSEKVAG